MITILLTVILMQNTGRDTFSFLWATIDTTKLTMLLLFTFIGFILGLLAGRPKRIKKLSIDVTADETKNKNLNTLSDEDKDYIK